MPSQVISSVENNFTRGLITEATGLNFPENAATDTSNCTYTLVGDVVRREGINQELNGGSTGIDRTGQAMSSFEWKNAGGDGVTKLLVKQIGSVLIFYSINASTFSAPLSTTIIGGSSTPTEISISQFAVGSFDPTQECQYAFGNGYLFVFHPSCDPFYVTYSAGTLTASVIKIQIRDFIGTADGFPVNVRPTIGNSEHQYNLQNQGWVAGAPWAANSSSDVVGAPGTRVFAVGAITGITLGQVVSLKGYSSGVVIVNCSGTVTNYAAGILTVNVLTSDTNLESQQWVITPTSTGYINTWISVEGNIPSNADVWWYFKDGTGVFNPAATANNVTLSTGAAPKGHYIFNAFNQDRASTSTIPNLTPVVTKSRPSTGEWFAGRVWYTGVNANQPVTGDALAYSWSCNIYFSQISTDVTQLGNCYQTNDPTSENLNGLLPTDGGIIVIPESGGIIKLFPTANGMLVFGNNGVWFITGSQGIGFAATDYTVTKISNVRALTNKSFVNVLGLPYFWNEEGIYKVMSTQNGSLTVEPITVGTILTYYNNIPIASKQYARGDYDPIGYTIQWAYRSTMESSVTDRYNLDSILNYNTYNKAFFPYLLSVSSNTSYIHGVNFVSYTNITINTPEPGFKYPSSSLSGTYQHSFAEEYDTKFVDWGSSNYVSSFTTGYKLHGSGQKRFQIPYLYIYSRMTQNPVAYYIQSIWDYATSPNSGRWSTQQYTSIFDSNHSVVMKRHKLRGLGLALQFKVISVDGVQFDIIGWSVYENLNQGV